MVSKIKKVLIFFQEQVIPEPRCLINIQAGVEKGRYKEASDVYTDLSLVFWNALFYNEPDSQIAMDAGSLKVKHCFKSWDIACLLNTFAF